MPTYRWLNPETGEEWDEFMSMTERDQFVKDNPHLQQVPNASFAFVDTVRLGRTKPDAGFRDLVKQIKKNNRGSTIQTDN